ncbi:MAG: hypothetical protein Q4C03_01835 [bacterium]|nr:hypothetical protein [bacterium]
MTATIRDEYVRLGALRTVLAKRIDEFTRELAQVRTKADADSIFERRDKLEDELADVLAKRSAIRSGRNLKTKV